MAVQSSVASSRFSHGTLERFCHCDVDHSSPDQSSRESRVLTAVQEDQTDQNGQKDQTDAFAVRRRDGDYGNLVEFRSRSRRSSADVKTEQSSMQQM